MKKSPTSVQQWVESLPSTSSNCAPPTTKSFAPLASPLFKNSISKRRFFPREISLQSDDASSQCSSVESVLEQRKPDPETVLLELGFGPPKGSNFISRIPSRFLQPSQLVSQAQLDKFLQQYGEKKYSLQGSPSSSRPRPKSS